MTKTQLQEEVSEISFYGISIKHIYDDISFHFQIGEIYSTFMLYTLYT